MADKPGQGFLGWLGRQVGHVKKAVKTDVTQPPAPPEKVVYRNGAVEEAPHPENTKLTLRRTTIDEVVENGSEEREKQ